MSLLVYPFFRNPCTDKVVHFQGPLNPPYNDLFGFESWRFTVWGSTTLQKIKCRLLISLKTTNIYAENGDLDELRKELELVNSNVTGIANELDIEPTTLQFRIENALEAIRTAKGLDRGGVFIG